MNGRFLAGTGSYFEEEKKRYEPVWADPTGHLQELILIEQKFRELSEREDKRTYEIISLREEMDTLKIRLEKIERRLTVDEEVLEIRDISLEQIKEEMLTLLADGKTRYADEIANELKVDIRDIVEAFKQLKTEGKLFIDDSKL